MNERMRRVLANMEKAGLDQILVSAPAALKYIAGVRVSPGERLCALLLKQNGECALYANRLFALSQSADYDLREYDDTDDSVACLAAGVSAGKLGVDRVWPSGFAVRLMEKRADVRLALGSAPVDDARMYKDEAELAAMRQSSLANDKATEATLRALREGESEAEVAARYLANAKAQGASGASFTPLICFGQNAAEPHHETGAQRAQTGDAAILDVGLLLGEYCSDMTRTCFLGKMTDEQKRVYDIVRKANEAGRAAVAPGVALADIDRAARSVIEKAGYGEYFLHRTGHGIGLEVHEPPDVSSSSAAIAQPGMVFSIEPGIYLKGRFGVRVEDLVAVTQTGAETLNHMTREPILL